LRIQPKHFHAFNAFWMAAGGAWAAVDGNWALTVMLGAGAVVAAAHWRLCRAVGQDL